MKNKIILILVLVFSLAILNVSAVTTQQEDLQLNASLCLNESRMIMTQMSEQGFNIMRINDSIKEAQSLFDSQVILKERKKNYDFSSVLTYCTSIAQIQESALLSREDLAVLLKVYNDSIVPGMNTSSIDEIISEIINEIESERYEKVSPLINKAYLEISSVKSSYTGLNVFYTNTAQGIRGMLLAKNKIFQVTNWIVLITILGLLIIFIIIYRTTILKWSLRRQIESLRTRKKTVKQLIMKLQNDYFQQGKIPEGEYNTRTKKFAEIIRDIDRQIPLLQEELVRLEPGAKKKQL